MNPFQRLSKLAATAANKSASGLRLWLLKKSCLDHIEGIAICDISIGQGPKDGFLNLTRQAMALIKSLDSRRYHRVCRQLDYIVNTELISGGNFDWKLKICHIDFSKHLTSDDPLWNLRGYARLLIHEATHGFLFEKGIPYDKETRERVERLCHLEEYRFALRFEPGYADTYPDPFKTEYYRWYWDSSGQVRGAAFWKRLLEAFRAPKSLKPIQIAPEDAKAYYDYGLTHRHEGNYDKAISYFSHAIQFDPKNARAYNERGLTYRFKGEYDKAIADYDNTVRLDPTFALAYSNRGYAYHCKGEYDRAIADYDHAIQLDPKLTLAYSNRARAYRSMGNYDKAIADYGHAIQLDPRFALAYTNRSIAYQYKGEYEKAIEDYGHVIHLNPKDAQAYKNLAWLLATCPQASFRDGKKAVEYATKACELSEWKDHNAAKTLAAACAEVGDFDNAVKWESNYLETPNLSANDITEAKKRLALYQANKPTPWISN
jgi:tetratricopeptide (TPR) repeat protein